MRVKRCLLFLVLSAILVLNSCGAEDGKATGNINSTGDSMESIIEYQFLESQDLEWKDNSLDDLQAVFNLPIQEIRSEGEIVSTGQSHCFVGVNGAIRFKNHYLGSKNSWSGVSGITLQGAEFSQEILSSYDGVGFPVHYVGPIAGGNDYVGYQYILDEKGQLIEQSYYVINESGEKIHETSGKELFGSQITDLAGDKDGNFHVLFPDGLRERYVIISTDGEKIFEAKVSYSKFQIMDDGRVLVREEMTDGGLTEGQKLLEADLEKGKTKVFASLNRETVLKEIKKYSLLCMTAKNDDEIIWCSNEGIFLCNKNGEDTRTLYRWANHGIDLYDVVGLYAKSDGTVCIIYQDSDGLQFMLLKPTFEKREVKSIIFAATHYNKDYFLHAAATFNKKYPTYNIEIRDDYEETPLLTQLGAGEGPVLIDTELTGFEALQKLWQPLDGFLEKTGLAEEIIPLTMQAGMIDGKTYGIITKFHFKTLLVNDNSFPDWNYETFLDAVECFDGPVMCYDAFAPADGRSQFFDLFINGLYDNAYMDAEQGTVIFGTSKFERILSLAEKAKEVPAQDNGLTLLNGKVLSEAREINGVYDLVGLRTRLESDKLYAAGFPTKNGAKHLIISQMPITVRSTATDEEKQMAYTFLKILLSYESAEKNATSSFSVRKDILQKQFENYEIAYMGNRDYLDLDREKEMALYDELLNNSIAYRLFPIDLQRVFDEEFEEYLDGEIPRELLDSRLKSRVGLYMDEN